VACARVWLCERECIQRGGCILVSSRFSRGCIPSWNASLRRPACSPEGLLGPAPAVGRPGVLPCHAGRTEVRRARALVRLCLLLGAKLLEDHLSDDRREDGDATGPLHLVEAIVCAQRARRP
jgi:hypothetical protein